MKYTTTLAASCCALLLALASPSSAAQIAAWDLEGLNGNQIATPPSFSASHVTATNMIRGPGLEITAVGLNSFSAEGWESNEPAQTSDEYFEWGFDVDSGLSVDLDETLFSFRVTALGFADTNWGVYTSLDGFNSPVETLTLPAATPVPFSIDLSELPNVTDSFRLRIYEEIGNVTIGTTFITEHGSNGNGSPGLDVQFTGEVVPEPTTVVLLLLGSVAMVTQRRRYTPLLT